MKTAYYLLLAAFLALASEIEPDHHRTAYAYPCYVENSWCFFDKPSPTNQYTPIVVKVDSCACRTRIKLRQPHEPYYPKVGDSVRVNKWHGGSYCSVIREIQH